MFAIFLVFTIFTIFHFRFVLTPQNVVENRLSSEAKELQNDINNLEKKLNYLETTNKNSREHLDRLFKSSTGK